MAAQNRGRSSMAGQVAVGATTMHGILVDEHTIHQQLRQN